MPEWVRTADIVRQNIFSFFLVTYISSITKKDIFCLLNCYMLTRNFSSHTHHHHPHKAFYIVLWWISTRLITKWNEKQTDENILFWADIAGLKTKKKICIWGEMGIICYEAWNLQIPFEWFVEYFFIFYAFYEILAYSSRCIKKYLENWK